MYETMVEQIYLWFCTSNGSIRLKLTETGNLSVITYDADLEELLPGNALVSDDTH